MIPNKLSLTLPPLRLSVTVAPAHPETHRVCLLLQ
jgi:hypothetical protein